MLSLQCKVIVSSAASNSINSSYYLSYHLETSLKDAEFFVMKEIKLINQII